MSTDLLNILYGFLGAIIGGAITAVTSIYVQRQSFRRDIYFKKLELCSIAMEYIRTLYKNERNEKLSGGLQNSDVHSTTREKEGNTFEQFYDQLVLLSSEKFEKDFQELRNEIQTKSDKDFSYFVERGMKIMKQELNVKRFLGGHKNR